MTVSVAVILSFLLARPVAWSDRELTIEQRQALLMPVAVAISLASHSYVDAAALLATGGYESGFVSVIVTGGDCAKAGFSCDSGKARGVWQEHAEACREAYRYKAGSEDSTRAEARCAIGLIRGAEARCHSLGGAYSLYATGHSCHWSGAAERVRATYRIERELAEIQRLDDGAGGEVASE